MRIKSSWAGSATTRPCSTQVYSSQLGKNQLSMHKRQSLLQKVGYCEGLKDISSSLENLDPGVFLKELTSVKFLILRSILETFGVSHNCNDGSLMPHR